MTTAQLNQLDMHLLIKSVFTRYSNVWSTNKRLTQAVNTFSNNLATIEGYKKAQEEHSKGIAQEKHLLKATLSKKAAFVASAMRAYAFATNNRVLEESIPYTESSLKVMRETMLPTSCQLILDKASSNIAQLGDEGITEAVLKQLTQLMNEFTGKKTKPQEAIKEVKAATESLAALFTVNNTLLKKQVDALVAQYEETVPEFFRAYTNARPIHDRGRRSKKSEVVSA